MQDKQNRLLAVSDNLIMLERGEEELLLVDPWAVEPLYIQKGRDYIKGLIRDAGRFDSREALEKAFPGDVELINTLLRHRILVEEHQPKTEEPPFSLKSPQKTNGMSLYLLLSQSCNLGCVYCLNGKKTYKTVDNLKMTEEVAFKSVERSLERLEPGGHLEIVFFGGEPLLNWPLVKKVIQHCAERLKPRHHDKHIKYHITSNLSILPEDFLQWAEEHHISVLCDVDGEPAIHDQCRPFKNGKPSHAFIAANIEKLVQGGVDISLRATLTRMNENKMMDIARHHKSMGVRGCALVPLNPVNSDEELLDEQLVPDASVLIEGLEDVYRSGIWPSERLFPFSVYTNKVRPGSRITMGCGAPHGNTPVVDVNGDVYPCIYLMGIQRFFLGNVLEKEWIDTSLLEQMKQNLFVDHLEDCKGCRWRYLCGGGCPVSRLTVLNNPDCTEKVRNYCSMINCAYTQKILELLFWELADAAGSTLKASSEPCDSVAMDAVQTVFC